MKSAEQWSLEFGYNGQAALARFIARIQYDAILHAAGIAEKIGGSVGQDNPQTGEPNEGDADRAVICWLMRETKTRQEWSRRYE